MNHSEGNRVAGKQRSPIVGKFALSEREVEVLRHLSLGQTIGQIARQMALSPNTVKFHLGRIYKKLQVPTQAGAVAKCIRGGII